MSIYSSKYANIQYCLLHNSHAQNSLVSKNKNLQEIFLDKKNIIKRLQRLMLDVKDLDTKIFVSRIISYFQIHQSSLKCHFPAKIGINQTKKQGQIQHSRSTPLLKKFPFKALQTSKMPLNLYQIQAKIKKFEKQLTETAVSKSSLKTTEKLAWINQQIIYSTNQQKIQPTIQPMISKSSPVECKCGLFSRLLIMLSGLMKAGIIDQINEQQINKIEIDVAYIQRLEASIVTKWNSTFDNHKKQIKAMMKELIKNESSILSLNKNQDQLTSKMKILKNQLQSSNLQIKKLNLEIQQLLKYKLKMKQKFTKLQEKLKQNAQNLENAYNSKKMIEQSKNFKIQTLNLSISLKQQEIVNLKTVIECLEKRRTCTDFSLLTSNQNQKCQISQRIQIDQIKKILVNSNSNSGIQSQKIIKKIQKDVKNQKSKQVEKQKRNLQMENDQLKERILLLEQKINYYELLASNQFNKIK